MFRRGQAEPLELERADPTLTLDAFINALKYGGLTYPGSGVEYTMPNSRQEDIGTGFPSLAQHAYKSDSVVFACMDVRLKLFSEARFQYRRRVNGRPTELFGDLSLRPLERPWPGGTTGDLLTKCIQYADLAGNAFIVRNGDGLGLLRPDWVTLVIGSNSDPDVMSWDVAAEIIGYVYQPGGPGSGRDPVPYPAADVAHFAPIPDPEARFRGMSWLTPVIREVMADKAATEHKLAFFENAATPNLAIKLDIPDVARMDEWEQWFKSRHSGSRNAYSTLFLGAGADVTVVGKDLQQLDFKSTQGAGETRIAAAAGTPPVIVGLSEGLQAATYSNYGQARRRFADQTMRPLWRNFAGSLQKILTLPGGAELWYDDRDIPALQEDAKDNAERQQVEATTLNTLIVAGFDPASAVKAVMADDFANLVHTGLVSVQLLPPGEAQGGTAVPAVNGSSASAGRELAQLAFWNERRRDAPPVINVTLPELPAAPDVTVNVEQPDVTVQLERVKPARRTIDFGDGRQATVTVADDTKRIDFGDGRVATVTDEEAKE
jgi:phage portal protein BeeE